MISSGLKFYGGSCLLLLLAFFPLEIFGQRVSLTGRVLTDSGTVVPGATVVIKENGFSTLTTNTGQYQFKGLKQGAYTVAAYFEGYEAQVKEITLSSEKNTLSFQLSSLTYELDEVTFEATGGGGFGIRKLEGIEGTAIYEGKKTEVVSLDAVVGNKAANNARQTFAKVAGLNIWESDGSGLQLGIGGRGLSPNRTSNFNTRQNGYDISADALGYPESYYTPPVEALDRIEVVRGAASLQYGTQFGGMVNFVMKDGPRNKPVEVESRQTLGSFGFFNSFNSIGGTKGKFRYFGYYQYKRGNGWRPNSDFDNHAAYGSVTFSASPRLSIRGEYTHMYYLAQQPGGLTDALFNQDARQSLRTRNWFKVTWNLAALIVDYKLSDKTELNVRTFSNNSSREALGVLERINVADLMNGRTLISDDYLNVGNETRLIHRYRLGDTTAAFVVGTRIYRGRTQQRQGDGTNESGPDFFYQDPENLEASDYTFPSTNFAAFAEHIFPIGKHITITPGLRFEHIFTRGEGYFRQTVRDMAGNIIVDNRVNEENERIRSFVLAGVGVSYKPGTKTEFYGNISQNYRAVTFNDLRIVNPNFIIDSTIQDERGFTADIGFRGNIRGLFYVDASLYYLRYADRIGLLLRADQPPLFLDYRFRTNIADSRTYGLEVVVEFDILRALRGWNKDAGLSVFVNMALNDARYIRTDNTSIRNRKVELVPEVMVRTGLTYTYKSFRAVGQFHYVGEHFTDATNTIRSSTAVNGIIPSYYIADLSLAYTWKWLQFEGGCNNLLNRMYFTRRATGYPGPGIIPSDGRSVYGMVGVKF
ncbi:MAG: TonB-dependent receptor [Bacteroidota bacterium]